MEESAAQLDPVPNLEGSLTKGTKIRKPSIDARGISPFSPQSSSNKVKQLNLEFGMFDKEIK